MWSRRDRLQARGAMCSSDGALRDNLLLLIMGFVFVQSGGPCCKVRRRRGLGRKGGLLLLMVGFVFVQPGGPCCEER